MTGALDLDRYAGHLIRRAEQVHTSLWSEFVSDTVTSQQFAVPNALRQSPGVDQSTVARLTSLDRSPAHHIALRLTEQHHVGRRRDLSDRRRTVPTPTTEGGKLHASLAPDAERINDELLAVFPGERRGEVLHTLAQISQR
ncbi:MarR family transcriptional regulator [Streptomyces sp. NPDC057101]|uniref:MarR family transcriptional regulator n=1 Tax=Streptomyces sp. NPDC057101 TaxID=3346020 RepID=UPI00363BB30A